ncbi:MAG TPA: hypothetical protein VMK12_18890 [Anaeromyxobacteraceae bacterium]|nr:hypothetical protein [Anaeromyxobacteraceae bacterium]
MKLAVQRLGQVRRVAESIGARARTSGCSYVLAPWAWASGLGEAVKRRDIPKPCTFPFRV